jgi:methionine--tRNA ligase beta chain
MENISFDQFQRIDIRIGTVIEASVPEWSHWVMRLEVDLGTEVGKKTVFAGIMKFFTPQDLIGKQFPFVVNLKPKKIGPGGDVSEAMMLMAVPSEDENIPPVLFKLSKEVPNGTKIG